MYEHARMLDLIERTLDHDPYCPVCGAPTTIEEIDGGLWLVCSATMTPSSLVGRLAAAILPHERRPIVDLAEELAA